ncbi:MAG TPA: flavin reductase family protein [Thermoanaerobaculia bacterium]|nr:flavin reductase family protein [Thermoanaerobaculia bacterium]
MISSQEFRNALRHFPAGVTVVTIRLGEEVHGLTVSAFASVSAEPPLVVTVIDHQHKAYTMLQEADAVFAVNILREDQAMMSERFAWLKDGDRFAAGRWGAAVTGAPILLDALAWLDCRVHSRYPAGTHHLYVGEVVASGVPTPEEPPLIYWNRTYRRLQVDPG